MDQRIINLYDRFTHGGMSRREFLDRLAELAGSAAAAAALVPLLQNDYAQAAIVAAERCAPGDRAARLRLAQGQDQRLPRARRRPRASARSSWSSTRTAGSIRTSRTSPAGSRLEGYLAYAVDLLSLVGGTPAERGRGARAAPEDEPGRRGRGAGRRGVVPQDASGIDRQGRRGRLLLRRPDDQSAGRLEPGARRRRRLLRAPDSGGAGRPTSRPRCCCTTPRPTKA